MLQKTSTNKNYKALVREIKDLNKWTNIPCSWIRKYRYYKVFNFPQVLADIEKLSIKFTGTCKGLRLSKMMLKKNKVGGLTLPKFKTYHKVQ